MSIATTVVAQDSRLSLCVTPGGYSFSQMIGTGIDSVNGSWVGSASASIGIDYAITERIGVRVLPGLESRGTKYSSSLDAEFGFAENELTVRHSYLFFGGPVTLRIKLSESGKINLNLGGYAGYLLRQSSSYSKTDVTPRVLITRYGDRRDRWDYGLCAGVYTAREIGRSQVNYGVRFYHGLYEFLDEGLWSEKRARFLNLLVYISWTPPISI